MTKAPGRRLYRHAAGIMVLALLACGGCGRGQNGGATAGRSPDATPPSAMLPPSGANPHGVPQASKPSLPAGHPAIGGASPAAGETVSGTVEIAPALRGQQPAKAVLFVVARRAGGREIVAVKREDGAQFPHAFVLSAGDTMTGDVPFSGVLDITARLSRSGDAIPATGDLEGVVRSVAVGQGGVKVVIDTTRP